MRSHKDSDVNRFMERLGNRAQETVAAGNSKIAGGTSSEPILADWNANGVWLRQLPDDEQGILRISIGGGEGLPVALNYCTFRGDRGRCIDLLRKALKALETDPQD